MIVEVLDLFTTNKSNYFPFRNNDIIMETNKIPIIKFLNTIYVIGILFYFFIKLIKDKNEHTITIVNMLITVTPGLKIFSFTVV